MPCLLFSTGKTPTIYQTKKPAGQQAMGKANYFGKTVADGIDLT